MNITSAEATDLMNMVNQITPYGELNYTQTGQQTVSNPALDANGNPTGQMVNYNIPTYTATQSYSPVGQQLLNYQEASQLNAGEAAQGLSGQIANEFASPINLPSTPDMTNQAVDQQLYSEYAPRIQYQQQQQETALDAKLQAQGITPGTPAYDNAITLMNQANTDQWNQMYLTGRQEATGEMQQNYQNQLQSALTQYNFPLQALGTLLGQGAPQNPQFGQTPSTSIAPANYEGDVQSAYADQMAAYQAETQQSNAMMGGMFSLLGSMGGLMMSDERAKEGLNDNAPEKVGELDNELPIYAYQYKFGGPPHIGVMAQDVEKVHPEAVKTIGGMRFVDYRKAVA